jgi:hypothetical protein
LAKKADAARLGAEVARVRSEIRVSVRPSAGKLVAVDVAAMLLLGPQGAVGYSGALLRTLDVLDVIEGKRRQTGTSRARSGL